MSSKVENSKWYCAPNVHNTATATSALDAHVKTADRLMTSDHQVFKLEWTTDRQGSVSDGGSLINLVPCLLTRITTR